MANLDRLWDWVGMAPPSGQACVQKKLVKIKKLNKIDAAFRKSPGHPIYNENMYGKMENTTSTIRLKHCVDRSGMDSLQN